jgi:hypothetical protein
LAPFSQGKKIGVTGDARIIHPFQDPGGSATALRELVATVADSLVALFQAPTVIIQER